MYSSKQGAIAFVYDVAPVLAQLGQEPYPLAMHYGRLPYEALVDGFFQWAINSFQYLDVQTYNELDYTSEVLSWYAAQTHALAALWDLFGIDERFCGRFTVVIRRRNVLWLCVLL